MEMNFCRRCGGKLSHQERHIYRCVNNHVLFSNASPSTGIFIVDKTNNTVTLSIRGIEPDKGMFDAFGGFIDGLESVENGVAREIKEEIGLTPDQYSKPEFLCSTTSKYNYGGEKMPVLSIIFTISLKPGAKLAPADDVADVITLPISDVPIEKVHAGVRHGIKALQESFN
ncbi:NUDIX domain-containing protein [Candidatus Saccharibacteria bacterium]|jgi:ADP-ribose pyrophosphatase YjhB (NUDIX family)|nr:NUDIX domain-containing protein [Candidatus Saccharibacteria bacterium]